MATQTGSIDLEATNAVKLAAEASVDNKLTNYATHAELTVSADNIKSEVAETYATKSEAALELSKSGTVVVLDEAADARLKALTIHGLSQQDGTPTPSAPVPIRSVESRNLFDPSAPIQTMQGCTYSVDGDSVTITATTVNAWPYVRWKVPLDGTSATLIVQSITAGGQAYLQLLDASGTVLATSAAITTAGGCVTLDRTGAVSAYVVLYARRTAAGSVGDTATLSNVMLQDGAVVHRFAPYGAIPIFVSGKNLLNTSITEATYAGVTYTQGNSGEIVLNGTKYGGGYYVVKQDAFSLQAGTYTFSAELVSGTATATPTATPTIYLLGNNDAAVFQVTPNAGSKKSHTVTLAEDTNIIKLRFGLFTDNSVYTNATYALQLEAGSTATAYEPYSSTATPIPVTLRSLPDGTHDEWISGETEDTLVQRVQRLYFDGSDMTGWAVQGSYASSGGGYYVYTNPDNDSTVTIATSNVRTNRLVWATGGLSVSANNTGKVGYANNPHYFRIRPEETTAAQTVSVLQTWLQSNPLEVLLPLATPITTTYPHVDLPYVSDGDSVWVDAQVTPTIDVTYWSENGSSVSALSSTLTQTAAGLELELQGKVDSDEEWVSWMHAGTDPTTHEPYLAMGQDSDYPSVVYGGSAAKFYDGEGDAASNVVASFGADGAVVGNVDSSHTSITPEVTAFHDANGNEAARISMSDQGAVTAWASYSVNPTTSWTDRTETGITPLPDFTLGDLELTVSVDGEAIHSYSIASLTEPQISVTYGDIDIKFQATQSGETWTAAMSCRNRNMSAQPTVTFGLSWEHIGTAPMWKFGGASDQGAYSFSAGDGNQPTGEGAVTLGLGLKANRQAQVVVGKHNKPYQSARFIVGNGTDDAGRSNALAVTDQGIETVGFIQTGGTVGLNGDAQQGWLTALGLATETIYETSGITIKRFGRMIVVQCHGVSGTANNNVPLANVDMSAYKPSYNASTIVCDTQSTVHFARLWVSASDGKPYLAFAGYNGASTWYGTLAYVY